MRFHTNLPVSHLPSTIAFYEKLFGVPAAKTKPDYAKFLAASETLNISFHQSKTASPKIDLHLGFEFSSQESLDAAHERLGEAGLLAGNRESGICCYANQDKFHVTDPDGYEWELYVLLEDTEQKIEKKTACCGGPPRTSQDETAAHPGCC